MKRTLIILTCLLSTVQLFAQKTNFSGTWQIDTIKTVFGQGPQWIIPRTIKVIQYTDKLELTRISVDQNFQEQAPVAETLLMDGTPLLRGVDGDAISTSLHWLNDQSFILTRNGGVNATETWTLQDNGKTLVVNRSVEQKSNGFKYTIKGYYSKQ